MTDPIQQASNLISTARSVVVLSGAGMSAESGVPTFRDAQTGLWERFAPEQLATERAFRAHPAMVWTWYMWRWHLVHGVAPNAGHTAIGQWQQHLAKTQGSLTVTTQNVDDLHERGGAQDVLHLHGSLHAFRCIDCDRDAAFNPMTMELGPDQEFDEANLMSPAACDYCASGMLRPGVVWFGEALPHFTFETAIEKLQSADLVVVIGSSGLVQPAASLPMIGRDAGAAIIEINPRATELSQTADVYIASTAAVALPKLVSEVL
ncbi:NAD-dependent deacylase [Enteractinococcus coprophilus]|uniref:NAD-dependent protein deacylase n=1 Tax=Enteractinococcus coprophilus TaxID=1027633 RepID=A0A543AF77_9MICC|nr:NAD-dependent deacylase [Enteractinococcus coprophilus]TQL71186.1 NAD-dependent deacetylase [Enteractinococcus coprophilus]